MNRRSRNAIESYPCYRLGLSGMRFEVLRFVGLSQAKPENLTTYYGEPLEHPELVASTNSEEAALAAMRLIGVEQFEDWR
jgi:hypothetical protein